MAWHQHRWGRNYWVEKGRYWFRRCDDCGEIDRWRTTGKPVDRYTCPNCHRIYGPLQGTCTNCGTKLEYKDTHPEPIVPLREIEQKLLEQIF